MPIEFAIVLVTLLLIGSTWLMFRLTDKLRAQP